MSALFFCLLFCTSRMAAQAAEETSYQNIDSKVFLLKQTSQFNFDSLVLFVQLNFKSDKEKLRAIYTWIASNITYDQTRLKSYEFNALYGLKSLSSSNSQNPDTVFKYKKAVCEGYCLLLNKCCSACGIQSRLVFGPTKSESGEVFDKIFHAWNVVKLEDKWQLLDVTWANGFVNEKNSYVKKFSDKYFLASPADFVKDHWPLDPMWQLLEHPTSKITFYQDKENEATPFFNFNDSIARYLLIEENRLDYINFLHYHAFDPDNVLYTKECDGILHDQVVKNINLASVYFDDYQLFLKKQQDKPVSEKLLNKAIALLQNPKTYLQTAIKNGEGKTFFHPEIQREVETMLLSAKKNLLDVEGSIKKYKNLIRKIKSG